MEGGITKCSVCGCLMNLYSRVTVCYLDTGIQHRLNLCVFFNHEWNRFQIRHRGLIADIRKMGEGNVTGVSIESVGYHAGRLD